MSNSSPASGVVPGPGGRPERGVPDALAVVGGEEIGEGHPVSLSRPGRPVRSPTIGGRRTMGGAGSDARNPGDR